MSEELKACPFCGGAARIESNRDWHKLFADHDDDCVFVDEVTMVVPATDEQLAALVADWNRRATLSSPSEAPSPVTGKLDEAVFEAWWQEHGQYCRAGGGDYEKTFAYRAAEYFSARGTSLSPSTAGEGISSVVKAPEPKA